MLIKAEMTDTRDRYKNQSDEETDSRIVFSNLFSFVIQIIKIF